MGFDILASSPDALAAQIRAEVAKWSKVVKDAGIQVELTTFPALSMPAICVQVLVLSARVVGTGRKTGA